MGSLDKVCCLSDSFVISCGTATFDPETDSLLALLVRWKKTGEYFLPKGRKDVHETLQQTAERETFEETGYAAKVCPAYFTTLATSNDDGDGDSRLSEPIAVTQRMNKGILKIIFWFVGSADSTKTQAKDTQQKGEDFEAYRLPFETAKTTLSWPDDRAVLEAAAKAIRAKRAMPLSGARFE